MSGTIRTEETIAISDHAASSSKCSCSAFSGSSTAACSEDPIDVRLAGLLDRHGDAAANSCESSPTSPPAPHRARHAGSVGNSSRCTLTSSPNRAHQASSAVKHSTGASQVHRHRCR